MNLVLSLFMAVIFVSCASNKTEDESTLDRRANIYYNQGTNQLANKMYSRALKNLLEANALKPDDSNIHNNLGMAYYFKGRTDRAVRYIKKAIKLDLKNTDARMNLATIYLNEKNYSESKRQYEVVLDDLTYEGQYRTYYNLGVLYQAKGKNNLAVNYFKQSLNERDSYCPSHFKLGDIYFQKSLYKKALEKFKKASLGTCYNNPEPQYHQALSLLKLRDFDSAKMKLEEIIERFSTTKFGKMAQRKLMALNLKNR